MSFVNQAGWDRTLRIVSGTAMFWFGWAGFLTAPWGAALQIFAFAPLVTGLTGWCPLYTLLRFRTDRRSGWKVRI